MSELLDRLVEKVNRLEGERDKLDAENGALRGLLAAIGESLPPLPEDAADMDAYTRECSRRLITVAGAAESAAAVDGKYAVAILEEKSPRLRRDWARPLRYVPESSELAKNSPQPV